MLIVSSGIVTNLAKSVSLQIRAQVDMGSQCTPSLNYFTRVVLGGQRILQPISCWTFDESNTKNGKTQRCWNQIVSW